MTEPQDDEHWLCVTYMCDKHQAVVAAARALADVADPTKLLGAIGRVNDVVRALDNGGDR